MVSPPVILSVTRDPTMTFFCILPHKMQSQIVYNMVNAYFFLIKPLNLFLLQNLNILLLTSASESRNSLQLYIVWNKSFIFSHFQNLYSLPISSIFLIGHLLNKVICILAIMFELPTINSSLLLPSCLPLWSCWTRLYSSLLHLSTANPIYSWWTSSWTTKTLSCVPIHVIPLAHPGETVVAQSTDFAMMADLLPWRVFVNQTDIIMEIVNKFFFIPDLILWVVQWHNVI